MGAHSAAANSTRMDDQTFQPRDFKRIRALRSLSWQHGHLSANPDEIEHLLNILFIETDAAMGDGPSDRPAIRRAMKACNGAAIDIEVLLTIPA